MEVILKQDIKGLGFKDDKVKVANGYGRNFLIPKGMAVLATTSRVKMHAETMKQRAFKDQKLRESALGGEVSPGRTQEYSFRGKSK